MIPVPFLFEVGLLSLKANEVPGLFSLQLPKLLIKWLSCNCSQCSCTHVQRLEIWPHQQNEATCTRLHCLDKPLICWQSKYAWDVLFITYTFLIIVLCTFRFFTTTLVEADIPLHCLWYQSIGLPNNESWISSTSHSHCIRYNIYRLKAHLVFVAVASRLY